MNSKVIKGLVVSLLMVISYIANAGIIELEPEEFGHYSATGENNGTAGHIFTGVVEGNEYRNWLKFDLAEVSGNIINASLTLFSPSKNDDLQTIQWFNVFSSNINGLGFSDEPQIFNDLGEGEMLAVGIASRDVLNTFNLNNVGLSELNNTIGSWAIGGVNISGGLAFGFTEDRETQSVSLKLTIGDSVSIPAPSSITILALGLMGLGARRLNLHN